jgi:hypothetical protein
VWTLKLTAVKLGGLTPKAVVGREGIGSLSEGLLQAESSGLIRKNLVGTATLEAVDEPSI